MMIPLLGKIETNIGKPIITLLFALAVVVFLYGVYEMVAGADSEEKRATGRQHILWGVIGIFIMVSAFGIINLICRTISCN